MRRFTLLAAASVAGAALIGAVAEGDRKSRAAATIARSARTRPSTTVHTDAVGLEGLTADTAATSTRRRVPGGPCPIVRVPASGGPAATVGQLPAPCSPAGLAFDRSGDLFVADGDEILRLRPSASSPPTATVFATGVRAPTASRSTARRPVGVRRRDGPGPGVADRDDGAARGIPRPADGQRRQLVARRRRRWPRPALGAAGDGDGHADGRQAANTLGPSLSWPTGSPSTATARCSRRHRARRNLAGRVRPPGHLRSPTGCDTTFTANTLCLHNVFVQHPALEGADGIALDREGNDRRRQRAQRGCGGDGTRRVVELFRNPLTRSGCATAGRWSFPPARCCRPQAVHGAFGRHPPRQLPQQRGRGRAGHAAREALLLDRRLPAEGLPLPVN